MYISVSIVVLLLIVAVVMMRSGALKIPHALVCVALGFYLASSSIAPTIENGLSATADIVSGIEP